MKITRLVVRFAACLLLTSTAQAMMAGASPDSPSARIDPNTLNSSFAGVGAVVVGSGVYSGVVIAPEYVLTAGHVGAAGSASSMQFILNIGSTPWTGAVQSVTIYPSYSFPNDDLAILKLATPVPSSVPVYSMYTGSISAGMPITLVGYGSSGNGDVGVTVGGSSSVKRIGRNAVDAVQNTLGSGTSRFFLYDFDGSSGNGALGGPTLGNSVETLVAPGDSGGPSFVMTSGTPQLFGINTFVGDTSYRFGTTGGGIIASDPRFASWLSAVTQGTMPTGQISADGPLPLWALAALAVSLTSVGMSRLRYQQAASG